MSTYSDYDARAWSDRAAELESEAAEMEREFRRSQAWLHSELAELYSTADRDAPGAQSWRRGASRAGRHWPEIIPAWPPMTAEPLRPSDGGSPAAPQQRQERTARRQPGTAGRAGTGRRDGSAKRGSSGTRPAAKSTAGRDEARDPAPAPLSPQERTDSIIVNGRRSAYAAAASRRRKAALAAAAITALVAVVAVIAGRGGPSWPASVAVVKADAARACQNHNVASEPTEVNFACATATRQILWVFALLTSDDQPAYDNPQTGRRGLEPITPALGGDVAWSLNLHHPYNPADPVDSLTVAARAINNIIGGATLTEPDGRPAVQPGLESGPANCLRYTGSAAVIARQGYPRICARPVTAAGEAALVADVFAKWMVTAPPSEARDAAVLFDHAQDPGNAQVQAILKALGPAAPARA